MKLSGAKLIEVGTTNKTYLTDFAEAITENTALIFSAHTSNYKIVGFTQEVGINELSALGKERGLPVMHDLGSGILADLSEWGLKDEPTVQTCLNSGADLITFSGDKLLGGPQAGIMIGKTRIINTMKKNQLTRALRVDKLTLAALEGTLIEYLLGEPRREIPVLRMLTVSEEELALKAKSLAEALQLVISNKSPKTKIKVAKVDDMVGGGAYPTYKIPGYAIELEFSDIELESIAYQLRQSSPAMIVRRQQGKMLISVRTLLAHEEEIVVDLFNHILDKQSQCSEERDSI
jgi:L-seryl-tRNA(Ser) seleniumtransferase